ncbi:unnamed protein product [Lactuca virosa]|uniref:Uncharacterized protein n=1 Tax=Lactuca virosa TaxID=75947 RepID=A0AAU9MJW8_9ASTR|nr:unnamed protein product [Lactuca virosa]
MDDVIGDGEGDVVAGWACIETLHFRFIIQPGGSVLRFTGDEQKQIQLFTFSFQVDVISCSPVIFSVGSDRQT